MHKVYYLLLLTLGLYANMSPQNVLTKNCLNSYKNSYLSQNEHKAFVYARERKTDKDRCNWGYGYVSTQEAIDSAMKGCQSELLNAECILIDTDGKFEVPYGTFSTISPADETPLSKDEIETRMKESKPVILGNCLPFFEKYLNVPEHKSFAYSVDVNGDYACGYSYNNQSEKISKIQAIKSCNDNKIKRGGKAPKSECKVYATNKKVLLTAKDFDIKPLPKTVQLSPEVFNKKLNEVQEIISNWPCRIQFKYYLKSKAHHAYYLVQDTDGQQMCGRSEGAFNSEVAKQIAKESCEKHAKDKQIKGECKLLSEDLEFVGRKEMFPLPKKERVSQNTEPKLEKKIQTTTVEKKPTIHEKKIDIHKPLSLNETLIITTETLNKTLPMMLDKELRFEKVEAKKNKMTFHYTLVHLTHKEMSADKLKSLLYADIKSQACAEKDFQLLLKKGMLLDYHYLGKDKQDISTFSFEAKTCGLLTNVEQIKKNILNLVRKK